LLEEELDYSQLFVHQTSVRYRNVTAEKMIFCNGVDTFQNGYWQDLPYVFNKGQALIADVPGLPEENIYKYGAITLAPWYDNTWWIGSSYENDFTSTSPTERFYNDTITFLKNILKIPFSVKEHFASLRPAVIERRPFVGLHPSYPSIGILNGMGTKGCSLAPYCAFQLSQHLLNDRPIDPLADVRRFHRLLSR
jgi:glycine/D-amino acid oxidase-like deaminating enzyme